MESIEKRLVLIDLLHIYGELLSNTQKDILIDYLECDLSLSEIADNRGISRAAVEDAIKKGIAKLNGFEDKLQFNSKRHKILKNTSVLKEKYGNSEEINEIEEALK